MNINIRLISGALAAMSLVACNDLDTAPMGDTYTEDQRAEAIEKNPDAIDAMMTAVYGNLYAFENNLEYLADFGVPSTILSLENRGQDMSMGQMYSWFEDAEEYSNNSPTNEGVICMWGTAYRVIFSANDILKIIPAGTENATLLNYKAQALAMRAWSLHMIVQGFATPYTVNPQAPGVPVITVENVDAATANGSPRGTVADVYKQIMADLDEAITIFSTPGVYTARADKRAIDPSVALGLRARANLCMGKYAEAATDAAAAIEAAEGGHSGVGVVGVPAFNNFSQSDFMWGIHIDEKDAHGLYTYAGMMGSLTYGYAYAGQVRCINAKLWDMIPEGDIRKGWWLGNEPNPAWLANGVYVYKSNADNYKPASYAQLGNYGAKYGLAVVLGLIEMPAGAVVKFAPYQDIILNTVGATDIPLMRTEEMALIVAEGLAHSDVNAAKTYLEKFVNTYRWTDSANPYVCSATTKEEMLDQVWFQRRIELWGEGFSYYDCLRLKKGIDRRGGGFPETCVFNIPANANILLLPFPNTEMEGNPAITSADQNPSGVVTPVTGADADANPYWYK